MKHIEPVAFVFDLGLDDPLKHAYVAAESELLQIINGLLVGPGHESVSLIQLWSDEPFQAFVLNEFRDGIGVRMGGLDECLVALSVASCHLNGTNGGPVGSDAYIACIDSCQQRVSHLASVVKIELFTIFVVDQFAICIFVV